MVRQEDACFYCEECELAFRNEEMANECEEFCKKNRACSMEIIKHAIKEKEGQK